MSCFGNLLTRSKVKEIKNGHNSIKGGEGQKPLIVNEMITSESNSNIGTTVFDQKSSSSSALATRDISMRPEHFSYHIGQKINTYTVYQFLNDGTYGRVLDVVDINNNHFAMKIVKADERYLDSARVEVEILQYINSQQHYPVRIVYLYAAFKYGRSYCMVLERLNFNLHEKLEALDDRGFPIQEVRFYLKQILQALAFLHDELKLIHTDLKPENLMLNEYGDIKLIDFGGATWDSDLCVHMINTRQYRAPEVILSCGRWSFPSDIWSLGCVAIELYSGKLFFDTRGDNLEHLWLIEKQCGSIPSNMVSQGLYKFSDWQNVSCERYSIIKNLMRSDDYLFEDLIKQMLVIEPKNRVSAKEALFHPFFYC